MRFDDADYWWEDDDEPTPTPPAIERTWQADEACGGRGGVVRRVRDWVRLRNALRILGLSYSEAKFECGPGDREIIRMAWRVDWTRRQNKRLPPQMQLPNSWDPDLALPAHPSMTRAS